MKNTYLGLKWLDSS